MSIAGSTWPILSISYRLFSALTSFRRNTARTGTDISGFFFFFYAPATTEIYTLSLHDALPISDLPGIPALRDFEKLDHHRALSRPRQMADRKSTRLNSSHVENSYTVFCLK